MLGLSEKLKPPDQRIGVFDVSNKDYHEGDGISSTHIKEMLRSPAHYKRWLLSEKKDSEDMLIGRAVHHYLFENSTFFETYAVAPKVDKRTIAGKETWAKFTAENPGKELLNEIQFTIIQMIVKSLQEKVCADQSNGKLFQGLMEKAFYWIDPDSGVLCKCKPDVLTTYGIITDLKVTENASEKEFQNQIARFAYFIQAAFYIDGVTEAVKQAGLKDIVIPDSQVLVAVEREAPYEVGIYQMEANAIALGRKLYKRALMQYAECNRTGIWPGYARVIQPIALPNWAYYAY